MTRDQIVRRYARRLDRFFACASFPTPRAEAFHRRLLAERAAALADFDAAAAAARAQKFAPRLVKKGRPR